jgi:hypothetical protein
MAAIADIDYHRMTILAITGDLGSAIAALRRPSPNPGENWPKWILPWARIPPLRHRPAISASL